MDGDGLVLALDPDAVDFPEYHILDRAARSLSDEDADTVSFCPTLRAQRAGIHTDANLRSAIARPARS